MSGFHLRVPVLPRIRYWGGVLIVLLTIVLLLLSHWRLTAARLNPLSTDLLDMLSLQGREYPARYIRVTDSVALSRAGVSRNPGFVMQRGEREVQVRAGAAIGAVGLYGNTESVRLVLKAYFFPKQADAEKLAELQQSLGKRIRLHERRTPDGIWLLLFALDPDESYSADELSSIRSGLDRHRARLGARVVFDQFENGTP